MSIELEYQISMMQGRDKDQKKKKVIDIYVRYVRARYEPFMIGKALFTCKYD